MEKSIENTIEIENVENEPILKNRELRKLIEFKLGKSKIEKEDLIEIEDIILNAKTMIGEPNIIYFEELDLFPNLKKIEIKNINIEENNIEKLKNIEEIHFENCEIETLKPLVNVKNLSICHSKVKDIEELKNIKQLELIDIELNDFEFLKQLKQLEQLSIKNVVDFSLEKINFFLPIKYLSVGGIEHIDTDIIKKYTNLETLSVDREKESVWKYTLEKIEKSNIKILLDDIYEY